ncbi:MAG: hypothetical protein KDC44_17850 [Phaeodactylibacter sp.]|nr:hypothetical protein [Phaeodactylibacter sp.]
MYSTLHPIVIIALLLSLSPQLWANEWPEEDLIPQPSIFDLLPNRENAIPVQIELNLTDLFEDRRSEEVQKGILRFEDEYGQVQQWRFKAELRGKYRRNFCDFPPIKLDFSKKDLQAKNMLPFDDLKLVTHCLDDPTGNTIVQREYLAYQLYQRLDKYSFRTKLVEVTYIDTGDSKKSITRLGIIIEDTDQLMDRLGVQEMDTVISNHNGLLAEQEMKHALFQYMIGNGDWNIPVRKNLKLAWAPKVQRFVAIPYDFDFCGMVNSKYAVAKSNHDIRSVTDRVYLGKLRPIEEMQATIDFFLEEKANIYAFIEQAPWLEKANRRYSLNYLDGFFKDIEKGKINFAPDEYYR